MTMMMRFANVCAWVVLSTATGWAQVLPTLPTLGDVTCGTSTGSVVTVSAGGDLQAAIDAAALGDTIKLEAGASFTGPFILKNKTSGSGCITIRTAAADFQIPSASNRINPTYAGALPKLIAPGLNEPAIKTEASAHHYKLLGLEVRPLNSAVAAPELIILGDAANTVLGNTPHHIEIDRVYAHGYSDSSTKRVIALHSASTTIKNSYINDAHVAGQDAQAICGWNGPGPYRIHNNYLEGAGENIMFGGADSVITNLIPSDIEITKNYIAKPYKWRDPTVGAIVANPLWDGSTWTIKNLLELKVGGRVLIDGNYIEGSWPQGQAGYAVVFTPRNQDGTNTWNSVRDVTFSNNIVKNAASGVALIGADDINTSQQTQRVRLHNNLWLNIGYPYADAESSGAGKGVLLLNDTAAVADATIEHNTWFQDGVILAPGTTGGVNKNTGFTWRNNIHRHNSYGVLGSGTGVGNTTLSDYFVSAVYTKNVMIDNPFPSSYPAGNFDAADLAAVGFSGVSDLHGTGTNYGLTGASAYHNAATDGTDVGVDWAALATKTMHVLTGIFTLCGGS